MVRFTLAVFISLLTIANANSNNRRGAPPPPGYNRRFNGPQDSIVDLWNGSNMSPQTLSGYGIHKTVAVDLCTSFVTSAASHVRSPCLEDFVREEGREGKLRDYEELVKDVKETMGDLERIRELVRRGEREEEEGRRGGGIFGAILGWIGGDKNKPRGVWDDYYEGKEEGAGGGEGGESEGEEMMRSLNDVATYLIQPNGDFVPGLFRRSNRAYLAALKLIKNVKVGEDAVESELRRLAGVVENVRRDRNRLAGDCERLVVMYRDTEGRLEEVEKRVKRGNRRRRIAERGAERLVGVVEEGKSRQALLEGEVAEAREELGRAVEEWEGRRKEWEAAKEGLEETVGGLEKDCKKERDAVEELTKYVGTLEKRLSGGFGRGAGLGRMVGELEGKREGLTGQVKELEGKKGELMEGVETLEVRKGELVEGMVELEGRRKELAVGVEELEGRRTGLVEGVEELEGRRGDLARAVEELEERRIELLDLVEEMERREEGSEGAGGGEDSELDSDFDPQMAPPAPPPPLVLRDEEEEEKENIPAAGNDDVNDDIPPPPPIEIMSPKDELDQEPRHGDKQGEGQGQEQEQEHGGGEEKDWQREIKGWVRKTRKFASKTTGKRGFFSKKVAEA
ncbi:hypothetical protein TrRE_jg4496 [Triparma retinervis]|uniref:Uncharacterized protein n=1 Tax=Triparma retinervis TaxID=2557542 RepID=A0A9W6ZUP2_9STRA|nr:hypothetical protein TrRE_jg4496 [Triparma retinervis]